MLRLLTNSGLVESDCCWLTRNAGLRRELLGAGNGGSSAKLRGHVRLDRLYRIAATPALCHKDGKPTLPVMVVRYEIPDSSSIVHNRLVL